MSRRVIRRRQLRRARRAVTLLEIVLAMGLLVVVSSMTYWFYSSSLETNRRGTEAAQKLRLARIVLSRITTEIRQASAMTVDDRVGIRGEPEQIWLSSHRVPGREQSRKRFSSEEPPPVEYDVTKVAYNIIRHPEIEHEDGYELPLGLARVEILIPRPEIPQSEEESEDEQGGGEGAWSESNLPAELTGETRLEEDDREEQGDASLAIDIQWDELYAPEIRYLRFCYYDGHKWWDKWEITGESPLPQLVLVAIGFEPHPPYGEETGLEEVNEEFCTCLNEDPVDCESLDADQFSTVVRVSQSDPLFRSRISRESQGLMEEFSGEPLP